MSIQVIFIAGASYSGSTFFGSALGNDPGFVCAGELHNWIRGFMHKTSTGQSCACGKLLTECPFWSEVTREWLQSTGYEDPRHYQALVLRYEKLRALPRLWVANRKPSAEFREYQDATLKLFEVLTRVSGKPVVVDISKKPVRACALSTIPGLDLRCIHLIRNGQAFISSVIRHYPKKWSRMGKNRPIFAVLKASREWRIVNMLCDRIPWFTGKPVLKIKYEDLVQRPAEVLERVAGFIGTDLHDLAMKIATGQPMSFGHTTGNAVRTTGSAPLKKDQDPFHAFPPHSRWIYQTVAGAYAHRNGYAWIDEKGLEK